jgi:two-component system chemotaxis response regulator CheB
MRALELGAVDFVGKPNGDVRAGMMELTEILRDKVRAAAVARVKPLDRQRPPGGGVTVSPPVEVGHDYRVIGMAASTGGVEALGEIIAALPPSLPGVMVVQHMPGGFTRSFAARLDTLSALTVREAGNGMRIERGHVYIAPGNHHLRLARDGNDDVCRLSDDKPVSGHRPSADVLFNSIAEIAGARSLGVILTGMGKDGAHGLLNMRLQGAVTLGQDESSSLIYGMPRVAHEIGAVTAQVPLKHMAATIPSWLAHERRAPIQV